MDVNTRVPPIMSLLGYTTDPTTGDVEAYYWNEAEQSLYTHSTYRASQLNHVSVDREEAEIKVLVNFAKLYGGNALAVAEAIRQRIDDRQSLQNIVTKRELLDAAKTPQVNRWYTLWIDSTLRRVQVMATVEDRVIVQAEEDGLGNKPLFLVDVLAFLPDEVQRSYPDLAKPTRYLTPASLSNKHILAMWFDGGQYLSPANETPEMLAAKRGYDVRKKEALQSKFRRKYPTRL